MTTLLCPFRRYGPHNHPLFRCFYLAVERILAENPDIIQLQDAAEPEADERSLKVPEKDGSTAEEGEARVSFQLLDELEW